MVRRNTQVFIAVLIIFVLAILVVLPIFGASIQNFAVVLLIGIIAGTYSSVCIAPVLLVVWNKGAGGRVVGGGRPAV